MKIHEWLQDFDSHGIYDAQHCAEDFRAQTGQEPCWPTRSHAATRRMIVARGLGGNLAVDHGHDLANGYEIAEALAERYAKSTAHLVFEGRGSRFRAAFDALRKADV
mgnify:CR=1 FL=1